MKTRKLNLKIKGLLSLILLANFVNFASAEDVSINSDQARARYKEKQTEIKIDQKRLVTRLVESKSVFEALLNAPDGGIPQNLLKNSNCIAVLPNVLKAAFVVGGEFGRGVMSCKTKEAEWSAPSFVELRAASFGWQIGGKSTDLVLFFAGEKAKHVITASKFTLGADIGVTAGPVGRRAEGSVSTELDGVYSYAHSEGIFVGLALNGADLISDVDANKTYYTAKTDVSSFFLNNVTISSLPDEAKAFITSLPQ
ncbi:MAG: lipid-binding SYLF domain-containing protein [Proteobacteria bacterium]|nr:lipid-binding SYLF domain-containing protein [Pseudomonadota bacterium]